MIEEAKKKVNDEMKKYKNCAPKIIGGYLLNQIEINPKCAEKIIAGEKTIKGAYDAIKSEAKKKTQSGYYCYEGEEGYKEFTASINKYYDFECVQIEVGEVIAPAVQEIEKPKKKAKFGVSIEDLL